MRAADIVNQLALCLPAQVDDFTTNIQITALSSAAGTATATTLTNHGLSVNQQVCVTGAQTPITCSITRSGIVGTLVTDTDHDMTENAGFDVVIIGAVEAEFNGTFTLLSVPNRRTVRFEIADTGATIATGAPLLLSGSSPLASYNGLVKVMAVPAADQFQYDVPFGIYSPAGGSPVAKTKPRISTGVTFERLKAAYTRQPPGAMWAFVVLGDAVADKSRHEDTDAISNMQRGHFFNARLIQTVDVYVFVPSSAELAGSLARDRCEELLKPICKCLLLAKFPSLVENTNNPLQISGHGTQDYEAAFYVHRYAFEATLQLGDSDVYVPDDDVAFRDIDMSILPSTAIDPLTATIDLDSEPI